MQSSQLYTLLSQNLEVDAKKWWSGYGSFWVVIESILGQNTKYDNVIKSRKNLENFGIASLKDITNITQDVLASLIKPSGFYNTKSKYLHLLCIEICNNFCDFDDFKNNASVRFLKKQKGLGFESIYSILCYACERPYMVFDKYTARLLAYYGYEFDDYEQAREYLQNAIYDIDLKQLNLTPELFYAHFHALIVEFCKKYLKKNVFSNEAKILLDSLA